MGQYVCCRVLLVLYGKKQLQPGRYRMTTKRDVRASAVGDGGGWAITDLTQMRRPSVPGADALAPYALHNLECKTLAPLDVVTTPRSLLTWVLQGSRTFCIAI